LGADFGARSGEVSTGGTDEAPASTVDGDGDGTVNLPSLMYAERAWQRANAAPASVYHVPGVAHEDTIKDERIIARIAAIITAKGQ